MGGPERRKEWLSERTRSGPTVEARRPLGSPPYAERYRRTGGLRVGEDAVDEPGEAGFEVGAPQGHGTVTTKTLEREGALAATDDAASFYVLPLAVAPDLSDELTCDWRDGDLW